MRGIEGKQVLLRLIVSESARVEHQAVFMRVIAVLREEGLAGATAVRGIAGFGHDREVHTDTIEALTVGLPIVVEVVDTQAGNDAGRKNALPYEGIEKRGLTALELSQSDDVEAALADPLGQRAAIARDSSGAEVARNHSDALQRRRRTQDVRHSAHAVRGFLRSIASPITASTVNAAPALKVAAGP